MHDSHYPEDTTVPVPSPPPQRPGEPHRHYFLRVEQSQATIGQSLVTRYTYKCLCGKMVSN